MPPNDDHIYRAIEGVKDLFNAKIEGQNSILERLTQAVEKQSEHNLQLAITVATVAKIQEEARESKEAVADLATRLSAVESKSDKTGWTVGVMRTAALAVLSFCAGALGHLIPPMILHHFHIGGGA